MMVARAAFAHWYFGYPSQISTRQTIQLPSQRLIIRHPRYNRFVERDTDIAKGTGSNRR